MAKTPETKLDQLAKTIKSHIAKRDKSHSDWVTATLALCRDLGKARAEFSSNNVFGVWLNQNQIAIKRNDRAAILNMANDLVLAEEILLTTERTSLRYIWEEEMEPCLPYVGKTDDTVTNRKPEPEPEPEYEYETEDKADEEEMAESRARSKARYEKGKATSEAWEREKWRFGIDDNDTILNSRKPFNYREFRLILSALHPDCVDMDRRSKAFNLFKSRESILRGLRLETV